LEGHDDADALSDERAERAEDVIEISSSGDEAEVRSTRSHGGIVVPQETGAVVVYQRQERPGGFSSGSASSEDE
jgi:hypothetical protein